jgi:hypothetical protein
MPLYLAFRGRWPDLTHEISGVWVLDPKLQFQFQNTVPGTKKEAQAGFDTEGTVDVA